MLRMGVKNGQCKKAYSCCIEIRLCARFNIATALGSIVIIRLVRWVSSGLLS